MRIAQLLAPWILLLALPGTVQAPKPTRPADAGKPLLVQHITEPWETCVRISHSGSVGSGTVIDSTPGTALILTAAHVVAGIDTVKIEVFGVESAPVQDEEDVIRLKAKVRGVCKGKVVHRDKEADLALVEIRIADSGTIPFSPVVPEGYEVSPGDKLHCGGCSVGADPTWWTTEVLEVHDNKNEGGWLRAKYAPLKGRSGGGLFDRGEYRGFLCGVVQAYQGQPDQNGQSLGGPLGNGTGIYAGPKAVHAYLEQAQYGRIIRRSPCPPGQTCPPVDPPKRERPPHGYAEPPLTVPKQNNGPADTIGWLIEGLAVDRITRSYAPTKDELMGVGLLAVVVVAGGAYFLLKKPAKRPTRKAAP